MNDNDVGKLIEEINKEVIEYVEENIVGKKSLNGKILTDVVHYAESRMHLNDSEHNYKAINPRIEGTTVVWDGWLVTYSKKDFADMEGLPERLKNFEWWLKNEPCTHPDNDELIKRRGRPLEPGESGVCLIHSNLRLMCPACRLRIAFAHCVYYADNYSDEEIAKTAKRQGITIEQMKNWLPFAPRDRKES